MSTQPSLDINFCRNKIAGFAAAQDLTNEIKAEGLKYRESNGSYRPKSKNADLRASAQRGYERHIDMVRDKVDSVWTHPRNWENLGDEEKLHWEEIAKAVLDK